MKKIFYLLFFLTATLSCDKEKNLPNNFDYGTIDGNVYKNSFFGFRLAFDSNWSVQNQQEMSEITDFALESAFDDHEKAKQTIDATKINVAQLFMIFKNEIGTTTDFNPSLVINVENLNQFPNIKEASDYVLQAKTSLKETNMEFNYRSDDYKVKIGNEEFICIEIENNDIGIQQDSFVTLRNGFALSIFLSYDNESDKEELYSIINSIKMNKY